MKRLMLAVVLSSLSMVGHASSAAPEDHVPFHAEGFGVDSAKHPGGIDAVVQIVATTPVLLVKNITVNNGECKSYKQIPTNYFVKQGVAFNLTFYSTKGKNCDAKIVQVETDTGIWEVE